MDTTAHTTPNDNSFCSLGGENRSFYRSHLRYNHEEQSGRKFGDKHHSLEEDPISYYPSSLVRPKFVSLKTSLNNEDKVTINWRNKQMKFEPMNISKKMTYQLKET